ESAGSENRRSRSVSLSPEKEDRCYTTRGSVAHGCEGENGAGGGVGDERGAAVLPRFFVSLSNKEKEEDFMAMKGWAWLSDLSQERYEVREKKGSRKRRRGLKAMCMESDSE
ncbi:hypothetical protein GW17_00042993, partial [Ensete ventricosum]